MDRSSFTIVENSDDLTKRQAFKAKLASKIDSPKLEELHVSDNTFNGVSPGGILVHPSLGEGTLVEVDYANNEVIINFNSKGIIGLVLSQAKSFVHAPTKEISTGMAGKDDAFIGSEIQSRLLAPQDRDFREVDFSKVISPDFIVPEKSFISTGKSVWHPDLGVCTVVSIDETTNNLTLSTSTNAVIDMVLSQVRSKLRAIETTPEHVPMKPLVREQLAKQVPQYKSRGDVSVSLPEAFKSWQRSQQFMFLTRSQSLTTEQANDVFAILDGDKPMFHNIGIAWQSKEETEANIIPSPEVTVADHGVKVYPSILENKNLWHPDFGECSVHSVDEKDNLLILQTSVGQVPCVMDVTLPSLAVLTTNIPEHAPKKLGVKSSVVPSPAKEVQSRVILLLPNEFNSWKQVEQYQYLTGNKHLTPEDANGFLAGSADKFKVQWTNKPPEANKRAEFKDQLLKRIETASVVQELPAPPTPVDSGIKRFVEKKIVTKKDSILKVSVDLPTDFKSWTSSGQYVFLTRTRQLTFNEANDVMDTLQGKPLTSSTQYEVIWHDDEPVAYATDYSVRRQTEEIDVVEKKSVLKKVEVTLPTDFKNWSDSKQYSFLTRARELTIDEANAVLNTLQDKPFNSAVDYEIVWSE